MGFKSKKGPFQSWNPQNKAWVKYELGKSGRFIPLDVKQHNPSKPFKGIPKRGRCR